MEASISTLAMLRHTTCWIQGIVPILIIVLVPFQMLTCFGNSHCASAPKVCRLLEKVTIIINHFLLGHSWSLRHIGLVAIILTLILLNFTVVDIARRKGPLFLGSCKLPFILVIWRLGALLIGSTWLFSAIATDTWVAPFGSSALALWVILLLAQSSLLFEELFGLYVHG